jgi:hypothetical protein
MNNRKFRERWPSVGLLNLGINQLNQ